MATLADIEAAVRASTDITDTGRLPQSVIYAFANEEYPELIRRIAEVAPYLYEAVSADLTVASGATSIDISALTTLMQILEVSFKSSGKYFVMRPAGFGAERDARRCWRQRGFPGAGCVIDIFPPEIAPADYRVRYIALPAALSSGTDVIKLPIGGARVLTEAISARVRVREEEDPSFHLQARDRAFDDLRRGLAPKGGVVGTNGRF